MNTTTNRHFAAPCVSAGVGMGGIDSGVVLGLVVVDGNRPAGHLTQLACPASAASMCATAGGLLNRFIAPH